MPRLADFRSETRGYAGLSARTHLVDSVAAGEAAPPEQRDTTGMPASSSRTARQRATHSEPQLASPFSHRLAQLSGYWLLRDTKTRFGCSALVTPPFAGICERSRPCQDGIAIFSDSLRYRFGQTPTPGTGCRDSLHAAARPLFWLLSARLFVVWNVVDARDLLHLQAGKLPCALHHPR